METSSKSEKGFGLSAVRPLAVLTMILALSLPVAYGLISSSTTIANSGAVKTVGVAAYWDRNCTSPVTSINWGTVEPGSNVSKVIFVKNRGNTPVNMSLGASNWNPFSTSSYMTLNWDYGGRSINAGQVIQVTLTLSVSSSVPKITSFSFDITITARG